MLCRIHLRENCEWCSTGLCLTDPPVFVDKSPQFVSKRCSKHGIEDCSTCSSRFFGLLPTKCGKHGEEDCFFCKIRPDPYDEIGGLERILLKEKLHRLDIPYFKEKWSPLPEDSLLIDRFIKPLREHIVSRRVVRVIIEEVVMAPTVTWRREVRKRTVNC